MYYVSLVQGMQWAAVLELCALVFIIRMVTEEKGRKHYGFFFSIVLKRIIVCVCVVCVCLRVGVCVYNICIYNYACVCGTVYLWMCVCV